MPNWSDIGRRHYVRLATAGNHWFDFSVGKVRSYQARFGDDFCLVVNGSREIDDAFVLPFRAVRDMFLEEASDGHRWSGTIVGSILNVSGKSLNVSKYHNNFGLLDATDSETQPAPIETVEDAIETTLRLESDLEDFLAENLNQLEQGLTLFKSANVSGRQVAAGAAGRIDILGQDAHGDFVVIEIKAGDVDREVVGQIQAYMGWVLENLATGKGVRGIVVASGFTDRLKLAARVSNLELKAYSVVFRFRDA